MNDIPQTNGDNSGSNEQRRVLSEEQALAAQGKRPGDGLAPPRHASPQAQGEGDRAVSSASEQGSQAQPERSEFQKTIDTFREQVQKGDDRGLQRPRDTPGQTQERGGRSL